MKKLFLLLYITHINSAILYTQWVEQSSGVSTSLNAVYSPAPPAFNNGWICGNNGVVLTTTNSGNIWTNVSSNIPTTVDLFNIYAVSYQTAFVSGKNASGTSFIYWNRIEYKIN